MLMFNFLNTCTTHVESLNARESRFLGKVVYNSYHPHFDEFTNWSDENTFLLGDLNAKHSDWGCSNNNHRGNELLDLMEDRGFMILYDGYPTHSSHSYKTEEALNLSLFSPDIYPYCKSTVLKNIGSNHYPILIEPNKRRKICVARKTHWNFKKVNWKSFGVFTDSGVTSSSLSSNYNNNWSNFVKRKRLSGLCSKIDSRTPGNWLKVLTASNLKPRAATLYWSKTGVFLTTAKGGQHIEHPF
ncbi:RNA-directed DNA polymerase from mobile element jockey [Caerostris extrusa]|uniref:RNA-directed DNA polymerase from mobile element jockey n=1 Tax=Caerostris extrusa TaxID=172846 RepID=A0AAV4V6A6_CAEEX|nr:RNA-directed DNA polymerase from mobile element jockey [Caerostris extrusa]